METLIYERRGFHDRGNSPKVQERVEIKMTEAMLNKSTTQSAIVNHIDFLAHNAKCDKAESIINESYCDGYEQALKDVAEIIAFTFELEEQTVNQ